MIASSRSFSVAASSSASCADERRRRRRNKNELWCRPCFNNSTSMRRTRVKATRDGKEEDFEDVPSSFSFMVSSSGDDNNNNNNSNKNNNNRR